MRFYRELKKTTNIIFMGLLSLFLPLIGLSGVASAGEPTPWQLGFQDAASPVAAKIAFLHDYVVLPVIVIISVFVIGLLIYIVVRFSEKNNPIPSKRTHHRNLEIIWTVIPVVILAVIFIPSFGIMKLAERAPSVDMTLKVTGNQWYWTYDYMDHEGLEFDAYILADDELKEGKRLMETDNPVVLPVGKNIRLLLTASDVLHNWAVPALAVRLDTNPGRLNETWVRIDKPGTYYGFCSELCGANHSYMPIQIQAVSVQQFNAWVQRQTAVGQTAVEQTSVASN